MSKHTEIEIILAKELTETRAAFEKARKSFTAIMAEVPSGTPSPDGTIRIANAGKAYRAALNAYAIALNQFNTFILDGTIPGRLKEKA